MLCYIFNITLKTLAPFGYRTGSFPQTAVRKIGLKDRERSKSVLRSASSLRPDSPVHHQTETFNLRTRFHHSFCSTKYRTAQRRSAASGETAAQRKCSTYFYFTSTYYSNINTKSSYGPRFTRTGLNRLII